ncbi:MAG: hypothetical protein RLZZ308_315 [Candidatus Parcubacteria bacterium]|jgi:predicted ferric reductase
MSTLLIIANILGYIGLLLLYIQVVFGSRHIFSIVTTDTVFVNKLHSFIGKYAIFAIFLHPLLSMMNRLEDVVWIITPNFFVTTEVYITFGRFAFMLFIIVWVTSAIIREKIKWRPWKYIHLLAYPIVALTFLHIIEIGSFFEKYKSIRFLWAMLLILFVVSLGVRLLAWMSITKKKYILHNKTYVGDDIMLISLLGVQHISSRIGQHFFLQSKRFGSEHPFSVIRNSENIITFGIRRVGGFWEEMNTKELGDVVYVDGPYGVFTREVHTTNPKVIISAGIGVTPFIGLVEEYGKNAIYLNCNRTIDEAVERDMIKSKVSVYVDIVNRYDGDPDPSIIVGQLQEDIISRYVSENVQSAPYCICGSPMFIQAVRGMLKNLGVPKHLIYYEELGF